MLILLLLMHGSRDSKDWRSSSQGGSGTYNPEKFKEFLSNIRSIQKTNKERTKANLGLNLMSILKGMTKAGEALLDDSTARGLNASESIIRSYDSATQREFLDAINKGREAQGLAPRKNFNESYTNQKELTAADIAKNKSENFFNSLFKNNSTLKKWLNNASNYAKPGQIGDQVLTQIGSIAAIIASSPIVNPSITAGAVKSGNSIENFYREAINNNSNISNIFNKGIANGSLNGTWEGLKWSLGQFVQSSKLNTISKALLNAGTAANDVPVESLVNSITKNIPLLKSFKDSGGISKMITNAGIAGGFTVAPSIISNITKKISNVLNNIAGKNAIAANFANNSPLKSSDYKTVDVNKVVNNLWAIFRKDPGRYNTGDDFIDALNNIKIFDTIDDYINEGLKDKRVTIQDLIDMGGFYRNGKIYMPPQSKYISNSQYLANVMHEVNHRLGSISKGITDKDIKELLRGWDEAATQANTLLQFTRFSNDDIIDSIVSIKENIFDLPIKSGYDFGVFTIARIDKAMEKIGYGGLWRAAQYDKDGSLQETFIRIINELIGDENGFLALSQNLNMAYPKSLGYRGNIDVAIETVNAIVDIMEENASKMVGG